MRPVERSELVDYMTYTDERPKIREQILATKAARRALVGEHLTFLFENHDTIWYQIQEMMRVEQIVRERDIEHERETYNGLLGGPGELGACLLISVLDPEERKVKLRQWADLLPLLYAELADGTKIRASWDAAQVDPERISSVQYLKFDTKGQVPVAMGSDHPDPAIGLRAPLPAAICEALAADLAAG